MSEKLTPEQYAQMVEEAKPYLIQLEERVQNIGYGTIAVELNVRAGVVEKMEWIERKSWLRAKNE